MVLLLLSLSTVFHLLVTPAVGDDSICNRTHLCSNTTIDCTDSSTPCNVECTDVLSCHNTKVICAPNQICTTTCAARGSCLSIQIECPTDSICTVNGTAPNALTNMNVTCNAANTDHECNILCNGHSTCSEATIDGRNSAGAVNIYCFGDEGCTDMTVYCPPFNEQGKLCNVSGWHVVGSPLDTVHTNLNIYAVHSWNDIDLSRYYAWVYPPSTMHCGTDYTDECLISNAGKVLEWNCVHNTSGCYYVDDSITSIRCNDDSECLSKTLECGDEDKPCSVRCTGRKSCSHSVINCPSQQPCTILCSGYESCDNGTQINCPSGADCNIMCGAPQIQYLQYGAFACRDAEITCPDELECNVAVFGERGFENGEIDCSNAGVCNIVCDGVAGCQESIFKGKDTELLRIECINKEEFNSCDDMKVYCPEYDDENGKKCIISGEGDEHRELELYCVNSWNDIDITNYSQSMILPASQSKMYCDAHYNDSCVLPPGALVANSCVCDYMGPPTQSPTPEIGDPRETDWILIVGVLITCFFITLCVLYWVLFMKKDKEMIAYEQYRAKQRLKEMENNKNKQKYNQIVSNENDSGDTDDNDEKETELPTVQTKQAGALQT